MYLLQSLYGANLYIFNNARLKKFVCLLFALFIDSRSHVRQPLFENDGFFARNKRDQCIYAVFVDDVRLILFPVACCQFQLSTNCRQLRLTPLYCVPIRTAIFTFCQRFCDIGGTKPPFGRLLVPNGSHGNIVKKNGWMF